MLALTLLMMSPVLAEPCTAVVAPPPELAGWQHPIAGAGTLTVGTAATVALTPAVRWAVAPGKPPAAGSTGASVAFTIATPGTYRIAIGAPAWIDVAEHGKALASTAHAHGPACSGVGKMVDFTLAPGRHVLQLSGATAPSATVMIVSLR